MKNRTTFLLLIGLFIFKSTFAQLGDKILSFPSIQSSGQRLESTSRYLIAPGENSAMSISGSAQVEYIAGREIILKPGFFAGNFIDDGSFYAHIDPLTMNVAWMYPEGTPGTVGDHEKLEIGFNFGNDLDLKIENFISNVQGDKINPFDPDQIDVYAEFRAPSGLVIRQNAFYYERYKTIPNSGESLPDFSHPVGSRNERTKVLVHAYSPQLDPLDIYRWRIRFAPPAIYGLWTCQIKIEGRNDSFTFDVNVVSSSNSGYLRVGADNLHLQFDKTGSYYAGVGLNIPWPDPNGYWQPSSDNPDFAWPLWVSDHTNTRTPLGYFREHLNYFKTMKGNLARMVFTQSDFDPEWENLGNYKKSLPYLMYMDSILDECHARDIRLIICQQGSNILNPAGESLEPNIQTAWELNPYKFGVKGNIELTNVHTFKDFVSDDDAKAYYKKRLRYIYARWGYSTNIALWQIVSETESVGGHAYYYSDQEFRLQFNQWQIEMATYIKNNLRGPQLVSASYNDPSWPDKIRTPSLDGLPMDQRFTGKFALFNNPFLQVTECHQYLNSKFDNKDRALNQYTMYNGNDLAPGIHKPYFIGEAGAGSRDGQCVDNCHVELTNRGMIWSSFFSGSWCTALQWQHRKILSDYGNDDNNYTSHDNIYTPLINFTGLIDFNELYHAKEPYDLQNSQAHRTIEYYMLGSLNGQKFYGWAHNANIYWYNLNKQFPTCDPIFNGDGAYVPPADGSGYLHDETNLNGYNWTSGGNPIIIDHLPAFAFFHKRYDALFYSTQTESLQLLGGVFNKRVGLDGKLRIDLPSPLLNIDNPDIAFSIIRNDAQRLSESSGNIGLIDTDSLFLCNEKDLEIGGYDTLLNYEWFVNDIWVSDITNPTIHFEIAGQYLLKVVISHDATTDTLTQLWIVMECPDSSAQLRLENPKLNSQIEIKESDQFELYPNPSSNYFTLACQTSLNKIFDVRLHSISGRLLYEKKWNSSSEFKFSSDTLARGVYFITIVNENNQLQCTLKLVII